MKNNYWFVSKNNFLLEVNQTDKYMDRQESLEETAMLDYLLTGCSKGRQNYEQKIN